MVSNVIAMCSIQYEIPNDMLFSVDGPSNNKKHYIERKQGQSAHMDFFIYMSLDVGKCHPWDSVALCGALWRSVALCGALWLCVALCGSVWRSVALCGALWCAVVLVFPTTSHKTLN